MRKARAHRDFSRTCVFAQERWPHVYTGNVMVDAAPLFLPLFPPIPAVPCTALGRALLDNWETEGLPTSLGTPSAPFS